MMKSGIPKTLGIEIRTARCVKVAERGRGMFVGGGGLLEGKRVGDLLEGGRGNAGAKVRGGELGWWKGAGDKGMMVGREAHGMMPAAIMKRSRGCKTLIPDLLSGRGWHRGPK